MNKLEEKIVELIKENQPIKQKALSDKLFEKYGYDLSTRQIREHILDINNYFINFFHNIKDFIFWYIRRNSAR